MLSMRWDSVLVRTLAFELDQRLRGQRVRGILMDSVDRRVHLFLRECTLVAEMHPAAGWVLLLDAATVDPDAASFPGQVRSVDAFPDERILRLSLKRVRGRDEGVDLILQWIGTRWNALVVGNQTHRIREVLLPRHGGDDTLIQGGVWAPPRRTPRPGAPDGPPLDPTALGAGPQQDKAPWLQRVAWASPLNAEALQSADGPSVWEKLADRPAVHGPCWIQEDSQGRAFLYPVLLSAAPSGLVQVPSLLDGMATLRAQALGHGGDLLLPRALKERGERLRKRLARQRKSLERELAQAPDAERLRGQGDLLLAFFHQIPRGANQAQLQDFDGEPIEISLDPSVSVQENASRFYREASRASRARAELPSRIAQVDQALQRLDDLMQQVESGQAPLAALDQHLDDAGIRATGGAAGPGGRFSADAAPTLPYHRFRSSGGLEIRVGRGARHNDDLTFRHARPGEIWLHVREAPGAHVILRWEGEGGPPGRDLEEAAILAAVHSDARHAGLVPVDWTRRKHVRKPRKAPPGAVVPQQVKTLFVAPDAALAKELRW